MAVDIFGIVDANIAAGAAIKASKTEGRYKIPYSQNGTVVANTGTHLATISGANATIVSFEATITETVATGADRTVNVDLQKSTGGGAFATVLSATIAFTNGSTARAITTATVSSAALVDGDHLRVVVTVAGAAGNQALGLGVTLTLKEDPV